MFVRLLAWQHLCLHGLHGLHDSFDSSMSIGAVELLRVRLLFSQALTSDVFFAIYIRRLCRYGQSKERGFSEK